MTKNLPAETAVTVLTPEESALIDGNLETLKPEQRVGLYLKICKSLGLNELTSPFGYIKFAKGGMKLYAKRECTEQLRKIHNVSFESLDVILSNEQLYVVRAVGTDGRGRRDFATGAVAVNGLRGEDLSNAIMKAETKAKRRFTLSICGLGITDESEVGSIAGARVISPQEAHSSLPAKSEPLSLPQTETPQEEPLAPVYYDVELATDKKKMADWLRKRGCEPDPITGVWKCPRDMGPKVEPYKVDPTTLVMSGEPNEPV